MNKNHDPKTGEFSSGPGGSVDELVTVMAAGPKERGVKLPSMTADEAAARVSGGRKKPAGKYVGDY